MEITIELGSEKRNINPLVDALGACRRGKWRRNSLPLMNLQDAEVAGLPDLPGYQVSVDLKAKRIRVFDPLANHPNKKEILEALRKFFKKPVAIEDESVTVDQAPATLDRWLCCMYRLCEAKQAALISGEWPKHILERVRAERLKDSEKCGMALEEEEAVSPVV